MKKIDMEKAKANLKAYARKEVAKDGLVQFRIEASILDRLLAMASERKISLSRLLREWVLNQLAIEESAAGREVGAIEILGALRANVEALEDKLTQETRK